MLNLFCNWLLPFLTSGWALFDSAVVIGARTKENEADRKRTTQRKRWRPR